ncbi:site-2 protease family protein [Candidatus Parcubacteria bacterium]|nr:MAG: site-2 protease family protein [Candidatus Parcubacteria bacterium]
MIFSLFSVYPILIFPWLAVILISITVHEFSHAFAAYKLGDATAERGGRLSLNPMDHIDWLGFVSLLILGFGWAKPVPFNPYNLSNPRWDSVKIALAGPLSNLILAIISAIIWRILAGLGILAEAGLLNFFLFWMVLVNLFLLFFNLIPVDPLDGSKLANALLIKPEHQKIRVFLLAYGSRILLILIFISILMDINVFAFISKPSYLVCSWLLGGSCY